tara:strand:+ start:7947 stop:8369 length:423 start_codon:yes stop_codon:yes gene_type:complete
MAHSIDEVLKVHGLKITSTRKRVLGLYYESDHALAHSDIEGQLDGEFDRVTLYRTLAAFEEKGIIHKVLDESGSVKYSLCNSSCQEDRHQDHHLHFQCEKCGNTFCLEGVHIPAPELPGGYQLSDWYMLAKGICQSCAVA